MIKKLLDTRHRRQQIELIDGLTLQLSLPDTHSKADSVYAFGMKKCGSTLLNDILLLASRHLPQSFYSFPDDCFNQGRNTVAVNRLIAPDSLRAVDTLFRKPGYIFGGFRLLPDRIPLPKLAERKKLLFVRDPRDALVSLYYSNRYSHVVVSGTDMEALRTQAEQYDLLEYVCLP